MISIYVNKYNPIPNSAWSDGNTETLLFSIPNTNHDLKGFLTASVNCDVTNAGSFEFSMDNSSIWYNIWRHMKTLVRVEYDGETIFYGRVLTIDRDMFRSKTIHCEGGFTFFNDSVYLGKKNGVTMSVNAYLSTLVNAHNECQEGVPEKQIFLGEVPGNYSNAIQENQKIKNDNQKFGEEGYKEVKQCLESLQSDYGGYMRVRYNSGDGKMYLDWLKLYFKNTENTQGLAVATNVLDLTDTVEVNNIFTHVIPVGKNNKYIDGNSGGGSGSGTGRADELHKIIIEDRTNGRNGSPEAIPVEAKKGTLITLNANVKTQTDSTFKSWEVLQGDVELGKGGKTSAQENVTFVMGETDVTIRANFEGEGIMIGGHSITLTAGGSMAGEFYQSHYQQVPNEPVSIVAYPFEDFGAQFINWEVTSGNVGVIDRTAMSTYFIMGDQDVAITGNFIGGNPPKSISVRKDGSRAGTVSASASTGFPGQTIYIDAEPYTGAQFMGWTVNSGGVTLRNHVMEHTSFEMGTQNVSITGTFEGGATVHLITVSKGGSKQGRVSSSHGSAGPGTTVTVNAIPNAGSVFGFWSVASGGVTLADATSPTTTFSMGSTDVEVVANFDVAP